MTKRKLGFFWAPTEESKKKNTRIGFTLIIILFFRYRFGRMMIILTQFFHPHTSLCLLGENWDGKHVMRTLRPLPLCRMAKTGRSSQALPPLPSWLYENFRNLHPPLVRILCSEQEKDHFRIG